MGGEKGKRRRCGGKTLLESQLSSNTIRSTRKGAVSLSGKCDWGVGGGVGGVIFCWWERGDKILRIPHC